MPDTSAPVCAAPTRKYPEGRTGTPAGHRAHSHAGQESCEPCRAANAVYLVTWRNTNRDDKRAYERDRRRRRQELVDELKAEPCADCGGRFPPECMDFDHVGDDKLYGIAQMSTRSLDSLLAEVAKCDLVCANCHRIRTRKRLNETGREVAQ